MADEIQNKLQRLGTFLDRHRLDGVLLRQRNNFAWITGGKDNHIPNNQSAGVASILATRSSRICITNNIEAVRMRDEELAGLGIETREYPWYDHSAAGKALQELTAGKTVATDTDHGGEFGEGARALKPMPGDFSELRWTLTREEVERYREGGRLASGAMELACRRLKANMTEFEIAGTLDYEVRNTGCVPVVTLIAADDRIVNFRHPIATHTKVRDYVMLVTCANYGGLISNLTRFVSFKPLSQELKRKFEAVANVDAHVNLATKPARTLGEIFGDLQKAYASNGFANEWQLHHQGGSTGYAGREVFATPVSAVKVLENQAFAWNPSITGSKSEDTILCSASGVEVLTPHSRDWPTLVGKSPLGELPRPGVLVH